MRFRICWGSTGPWTRLLEESDFMNHESTECTNPATGEVLGQSPLNTAEDVRLAVLNAQAAQAKWADFSVRERARAMRRVRDYLIEHVDELAETILRTTARCVWMPWRRRYFRPPWPPASMRAGLGGSCEPGDFGPGIGCSPTRHRRFAVCRGEWWRSFRRGTIPWEFPFPRSSWPCWRATVWCSRWRRRRRWWGELWSGPLRRPRCPRDCSAT